jgi:serine/threonine protein phosphatase PrpC
MSYRSDTVALVLATAVRSHAGTHAVNEDAAAEATAQGHTLLVIADGLGGHHGGEVASALAVDRVVDAFRAGPSLETSALDALIHAAHRALQESAPDRGAADLRTTMTLLVSDGISARWAHVGDSRLYVFHDATIQTRTRDHSVPELLHRAGDISADQIRHHPDRSRLLQALGQHGDLKVAVSEPLTLRSGDALLLCSDGWWEGISEQEMEATLRSAVHPRDWLTAMATSIVAGAQAPQDNYTAVAAFVAPPRAA